MSEPLKRPQLAPSSAATSTAAPSDELAIEPDAAHSSSPSRRSPGRFLQSNVQSDPSWRIMVFFAFLTGFTSAPTFLACYIWAGFQTGNLVQLGLAVARLFATSDKTFHKPDQQALTSLLSFIVGTSLGRFGVRIGAQRRTWLIGSTFLTALLCMAASLCAHFSGEESVAEFRTAASWQNARGMAALGFASAALGLQGIVAKRINSQLATTVVLTTVYVDLFNDPALFARRLVKTRDHRILGVVAAFTGGMCSAGIVFASSSAVAFGVAAGLRLIAALAWLVIPSAP